MDSPLCLPCPALAAGHRPGHARGCFHHQGSGLLVFLPAKETMSGSFKNITSAERWSRGSMRQEQSQ